MRRSTWWARLAEAAVSLSLLCVFTLTACEPDNPGPDDNPTQLKDSSGVVFPWTCGVGGCRLGEAPAGRLLGKKCFAGETFGAGQIWGRFYEICSACISPEGSWAILPANCRPVACEQDGDCPQLYGSMSHRFGCRKGLCQNTEEYGDRLDPAIVTSLCLAKLDRHASNQAVQAAMTAAERGCPVGGAHCDVPPSCWEP